MRNWDMPAIVRSQSTELGAMAGEAAARYRARVDAVLAQRTRLRGEEPLGDLFGGLPPDHPLMIAKRSNSTFATTASTCHAL